MLELHIWGAGFDLPSVDPLCLAAIAYLNLAVPGEDWIVIPSSNPLLSPSKSLPALRENGNWVSGFPQIVEYTRQRFPNGDLDGILSPRERASAVALSAYIQSRAQEALDLSLFVDGKNFTTVTRPLLAGLLPWPVCYYYPVVARRKARERTLHLGLSSAGEEEEEEEARKAAAAVAGESPGERAVREAKSGDSRPAVRKELKFTAVCNSFLAPLDRRVQQGDGPYLFGEQPSTADCIALGYLALLLVPELPNPWTTDALKRFPRLAAYAHDLRGRFLSGANIGPVERADLPWLTGVLLDGAKGALGGWKDSDEEWRDDDPIIEERKKRAVEMRRRERWKSLGFVVGGLATMAGYVLWSGIVAIKSTDADDKEEEEGGEEEAEEVGDDDEAEPTLDDGEAEAVDVGDAEFEGQHE